MPPLNSPSFQGLNNILEGFGNESSLFVDEALDDMDGEREADFGDQPQVDKDEKMKTLIDLEIPELVDDSDDEDEDYEDEEDNEVGGKDDKANEHQMRPDLDTHTQQKQQHPSAQASGSRPPLDSSKLRDIVNEASKGVGAGTAADYQRIMKNAQKFFVDRGLIDGEFFVPDPHPNSAEMIVSFIMHSCDSINLDGTAKDPSEIRSGYAHAQKLRAAFTYGFNRVVGLGVGVWERSEVTGKMKGNPSVSSLVSSYMVSLRRRKVQSGETATSARAVTPELIGQMYDYNRRPENFTIRRYGPSKRKKKDELREEWGGPRLRRELHLAYTLAFACLLRVDEVLKIQAHDIKLVPGNRDCLELSLPFRKTNQFGQIQPFYLYALPEALKHLCPVRAYADWVNLTGINEGYIFRKLGSGDRISADPTVQLSSENFLAGFRNNLMDIGVDASPYGTHSFRRGGCQWLSADLRWPLRKICEWGGWSSDFSYLTIVKYLISWNDDPRNKREDFFNMERKPESRCFACGRGCDCA